MSKDTEAPEQDQELQEEFRGAAEAEYQRLIARLKKEAELGEQTHVESPSE